MIDLLQTLGDLGCHFVVPMHPDRAYPAEGCARMIAKVGLTSFLDLGHGICNVTFDSAGLNGFSHKCMPHTQVNNIHGKEKEQFIKQLLEKGWIFDQGSPKKFCFEVGGLTCRCPSLTHIVGMTTDGLNSAIEMSTSSLLLGMK